MHLLIILLGRHCTARFPRDIMIYQPFPLNPLIQVNGPNQKSHFKVSAAFTQSLGSRKMTDVIHRLLSQFLPCPFYTRVTSSFQGAGFTSFMTKLHFILTYLIGLVQPNTDYLLQFSHLYVISNLYDFLPINIMQKDTFCSMFKQLSYNESGWWPETVKLQKIKKQHKSMHAPSSPPPSFTSLVRSTRMTRWEKSQRDFDITMLHFAKWMPCYILQNAKWMGSTVGAYWFSLWNWSCEKSYIWKCTALNN